MRQFPLTLLLLALAATAATACSSTVPPQESGTDDDPPDGRVENWSTPKPAIEDAPTASDHDAAGLRAMELLDSMWASDDPSVWRSATIELAILLPYSNRELLTVWRTCPDIEARRVACRSLGSMAGDPTRDFSDADPLQRQVWIGEVFSPEWSDHDGRVALLRLALHDPEPAVRATAASGVAMLIDAGADTRARLIEACRAAPLDPDRACWNELERLLEHRIVRDLFCALVRVDPAVHGVAAVRALVRRPSLDYHAVRALRSACDSPYSVLRDAARLELADPQMRVRLGSADTDNWARSAGIQLLLREAGASLRNEDLLSFLDPARGEDAAAHDVLRELVRRAGEDGDAALLAHVADRVDEAGVPVEWLETVTGALRESDASGGNFLLVPARFRGELVRGIYPDTQAVLDAFDRVHTGGDGTRLAAARDLDRLAEHWKTCVGSGSLAPAVVLPLVTLLRQPETVAPDGEASVREHLLRVLVRLRFTGTEYRNKPFRHDGALAAATAVVCDLLEANPPGYLLDELVHCLATFARDELRTRSERFASLWTDDAPADLERELLMAIQHFDEATARKLRPRVVSAYLRRASSFPIFDRKRLRAALDAVALDEVAMQRLVQPLTESGGNGRYLHAVDLLALRKAECTVGQAATILAVALNPAERQRAFGAFVDDILDALEERSGPNLLLPMVRNSMAPDSAANDVDLPNVIACIQAKSATACADFRRASLDLARRFDAVGCNAARVAAGLLDDPAGAAVIETAVDPVGPTAIGAARSIAALGETAWRRLPALRAALDAHPDAEPEWKAAITEAIGSFGEHAGDAVPDLLAQAAAEIAPLQLSATMLAIARITGDDPSHDPAFLPLLVDGVAHPDPRVRLAAAHVLDSIGDRTLAHDRGVAVSLARMVSLGEDPAAARILANLDPAISGAALRDELRDKSDPDIARRLLHALAAGDGPVPGIDLERFADQRELHGIAAAVVCLRGTEAETITTAIPVVAAELAEYDDHLGMGHRRIDAPWLIRALATHAATRSDARDGLAVFVNETGEHANDSFRLLAVKKHELETDRDLVALAGRALADASRREDDASPGSAREDASKLLEQWRHATGWHQRYLLPKIAASAPLEQSWPIVRAALADADLRTLAIAEVWRFMDHPPARDTVYVELRIQTGRPHTDWRGANPRLPLDVIEWLAEAAGNDPERRLEAGEAIAFASRRSSPCTPTQRIRILRALAKTGPHPEALAWVRDELARPHADIHAAALDALLAWLQREWHPVGDARTLHVGDRGDPSCVIRGLAAEIDQLLASGE